MANHGMIRIAKELSAIQRSNDLSIAVACRDCDVTTVRALIIGPPDTPYESGFFEFSCRFGPGYPDQAPAVQALTTNGGRCRFNPNIYANGKVCLSILGTWRGERGEQWTSAQSLESLLISIQSLMSSNPYENEPGYEQANSKSDLQLQKHYVQKIRHETLRVAVIQPLEQYLCIAPDGTPFQGSICRADSPQTAGSDVDMTSSEESSLLGGALAEEAGSPYVEFVPFTDLVKRRFLWHYNSYLLTIDKAKEEVKDNHGFEIMPFEDRSNGMFGKFNYTDLEKRLRNIKQALDAETMRWGVEGKASYAGETGIAANLARQFAAAKAECKQRSDVTIDLQLVDDNPFVWEVTYFGRPMTNLDGGLFRILVHISPRFPDEQPRIKFATPIFHHRITKDGTPCYVASKPDEIKSHISSVIQSLEDESPPFDPRTSVINPEAGAMYWGGPEERKKYNRLLRRAVQRSTEEF